MAVERLELGCRVESESSGLLQHSLELSLGVECSDIVASASEFPADEYARHAAAGSDLAQIILNRIAVIALIELTAQRGKRKNKRKLKRTISEGLSAQSSMVTQQVSAAQVRTSSTL